jgi:hypothetical protein
MGLEALWRKAIIWSRKAQQAQTQTFPASEIAQFRFYQFKASTAAFFYDRLAKTEIRVSDTPHYQLAKAFAGDSQQKTIEAARYYTDYLRASWGTDDDSVLERRVGAFRNHFEACRSEGNIKKPVLTRFGSGADYFVADGNHRTAIALALGRDIEVTLLSADLTFLRYSYMSEFYGTGRRNMPYQSLFLNREEVISGRRNDAIRRLEMIPFDVLRGARILDVASNVGMSSLLSISFGAASSLGLEISPKMVDVATRFSTFEGVYPHIQFRSFNIDDDRLAPEDKFDVAFMFSIFSHLQKPERLTDIARDNVIRYVVFEGHPGGQREDYAQFFDSGLFSSVSEIGALPESKFRHEPRRILWLCKKKQSK